MLGIIIGIAAIITIFSIIQGNTEQLKKQMSGGNNNTIMVKFDSKKNLNGSFGKNDQGKKPAFVPEISEQQLQKIAQLPGYKNAAPVYQTYGNIAQKDKNIQGEIIATTENYLKMNGYIVSAGSLLTQSEWKHPSQRMMMEEAVYRRFFPNNDGIGKKLELNGIPFEVAGVVKKQEPENNAEWMGDGNKVFIPEKSWRIVNKSLNPEPAVQVQGTTADLLKDLALQTGAILAANLPASDYTYGAENLAQYEKSLEETNKSQMYLLIGVASISLLVGGVGVMNIMLVSVTERTREIGIKKALGARRRLILKQFLIEASLLTLIGGVMGVIIGIVAGKIATTLMGYPYLISWVSVVASLLFSVMIGMIFGMMPALKASKLSPIEALRYE